MKISNKMKTIFIMFILKIINKLLNYLKNINN